MVTRFSSEYLNQLELLKLESRRKFLGARHGGHISLKKGHGIEFSDYRQYQLGDNPRYIDWKVYGRSDKLYVKRSQEEQDFGVSIFLDSSTSMGIESDPEKWAYACDLALSLSYLTLIQQDKLNLELLSSDARFSANSLKSFWTISNRLKEVQPKEIRSESIAESLKKASLRTKFPGLAVFISDLHFSMQDLQQGIKYLQAKNLEIVVIQILGKQDLSPLNLLQDAELEDSENSESFNLHFSSESQGQLKKLIEKHSSDCREYFTKQQIAFSIFKTDQDLINSLRQSKHALKVIR
jgi:uncharacterized protein (DUF58 family)